MSAQYVPDQVLGHEDECDGIEEYDNQLPTWWLGLFFFCVAWAPIYAVHYHFIAKRSQAKAWEAEMAAADQRWPQASPEAVAAMEVTPAVIEEGKAIFMTNCVACHAADLTGGIGPNLTDAEWIHGGTQEQIVATVTSGVADKGMPQWGPILGAEKVFKVSVFVHQAGGGQ